MKENFEKKCVIGIDIGTSGVKVIAINEFASIITSVVEEYPLYTPAPGWTEQNPADWWKATCKSLKAVTATLDSLNFKISSIGFSGQMHGMVALDKDNEVIRNAILWNDQRTVSQCIEITNAAGGVASLVEMTNNNMLTGYTGGKILWLKQNEPSNYAKTKIIVNPKDYIRFLLTGNIYTEVSDASGFGLYDVKHNCWNLELIKLIGLDIDMFPAVFESGYGDSSGVTPTASELTGLPAKTPVVCGGGDAVISTTGLGLIKPGRIAVTLGTSGVVAMGLPEFAHNPDGLLQIFRGNSPESFVAMGVTLSAAGSYHWFRNALGRYEKEISAKSGKSSFAILDEQAASTAPGSDGLIFLPYLNGERCPYNDPDIRGSFIGISTQHTIGHFARAVMEGVAFSIKQVYDLMAKANDGQITSREIILAGGGASSAIWRQIFADVFNLPVITVYGSTEGGSFGAALVAGVSAGVWSSLEETVGFIKVESETLPQSSNRDIYNRIYKKYAGLYASTAWVFKGNNE